MVYEYNLRHHAATLTARMPGITTGSFSRILTDVGGKNLLVRQGCADLGEQPRISATAGWTRDGTQASRPGIGHDALVQPMPEALIEGEQIRVSGLYVAHWEWSRFELRVRRRFLPARRVLCTLEARDGIPPTVWAAAGMAQPDPAVWRHSPRATFDVVAEVTPIESGHFGHRGTLRWRLRVDEWLSVTPRT